MLELSPYVAAHLTDMLAMSPGKLAKRMKCSSRNADKAQKLIVLTLVKNYRLAHGVDVSDLEQRSQALTAQMSKAREGDLASVFASLMVPAQRSGRPASGADHD
jgi:hypothetical protein